MTGSHRLRAENAARRPTSPPHCARCRSRAAGQRGVALLVVLWVVALLGVVTGSYAVTVRTDTRIVDNRIALAQCRAAAGAGIHLAVLRLLDSDPEQRWYPDGSEYMTTFSGASLRILINDEAGKIDVNHARSELITNLLRAAGVEDAQAAFLTDAILDWRDTDDLRRLNGAENDDYRAADRDYLPRNAPFRSVDELSLVLGMEGEVFDTIRNSVTVYSGTTGVNASVATPLAGMALRGAVPDPAGATGAFEQEDPTLQPPRPAAGSPRQGSAQRIFSIQVQAEMPGGIRQGVSAVVSLRPTRPGAPLTILAWRETAPPLPE